VGIRGSGELGAPTTDREWGLGAMGECEEWELGIGNYQPLTTNH